jgi:hypothetical protein
LFWLARFAAKAGTQLKRILIALSLCSLCGTANALDKSEGDYARVVIGVWILATFCPSYVPVSSDVIKYLGKRSIGEEKTRAIGEAVGSRILVVMRKGGMSLPKSAADDPSRLNPEISPIVDAVTSGFLALYGQDKESACQNVGDGAIKSGLAEKAK